MIMMRRYLIKFQTHILHLWLCFSLYYVFRFQAFPKMGQGRTTTYCFLIICSQIRDESHCSFMGEQGNHLPRLIAKGRKWACFCGYNWLNGQKILRYSLTITSYMFLICTYKTIQELSSTVVKLAKCLTIHYCNRHIFELHVS